METLHGRRLNCSSSERGSCRWVMARETRKLHTVAVRTARQAKQEGADNEKNSTSLQSALLIQTTLHGRRPNCSSGETGSCRQRKKFYKLAICIAHPKKKTLHGRRLNCSSGETSLQSELLILFHDADSRQYRDTPGGMLPAKSTSNVNVVLLHNSITHLSGAVLMWNSKTGKIWLDP